ncbi:hypothetical protein M5D96_006841 [Drosophila gunungcola]|uniref:Uncharacterized protein n=1 Tax=Drosophila gunungcola TaxID=103775 RepID=A0A9P9YQH3_9MUSC|nr:hypothetical protein M5D96_006841 [Drosophila gunungcola]
MDEDGEFILSPDCLLEIMNYVITDCKLKDQNVVQCSSIYDDLIHFVLADEVFWELLVIHHKRLYEDLEMAISGKIIKLLIDMRVNKIPSENEHCWRSYLRSIRENSPYNVELSFEGHKEKRDHTYVNISIKGTSTQLTNTEKLKLNGNITTQELTDICILNQTNLKMLTFEGSKIHGSFSDIVPFCENLEELRIRLKPGDGAAQYGSLAKPKSLQPLTLTIEDCLSDKSQHIAFATWNSLRYMHIHNYEVNNWRITKRNVLVKYEYDLCDISEDSSSIEESLATITLGKYVQASIMTEKFRVTLKRNENKMEIHIFWNSFRADILAPLAQLTGVNTLQISGCPNTGSLNPFFQAFATNTTGIEKLANLNKLKDLEIFGNGNLTALFIKLADTDSIQRIRYSGGLDHKEVIMVSRISTSKVPTFHVIREVYDSSNAHERFEAELDKALEAKVDFIIIEPPRLGDETGRWIWVGNCLHKTAVATGVISLVASLLWRDRPIIAAPACALSLFCTGLYTVSWNYDPCCQYQVLNQTSSGLQVENNETVLEKLPLTDVSSPVILGYSPNSKTKYLHRGVSFLSAALCAWQIWRSYK